MKIFRIIFISIIVFIFNSGESKNFSVFIDLPAETQDINIFVNIPATAKVDSSFIVEIKIVLGNTDIKSARITQTLPLGFSASVIDAQGSIFSFQDQVVKFLFIGGLYPNTEYLLKYKVSVASFVSGTFNITGELRYASNGACTQRLPVKNIKIEN